MRVTTLDIQEMKQKGEKISMLTAYDYSIARILDEMGIPMLLVGDSLGMVALGYESTIPVTMEEMLHHTRAVARGARSALVVGDMPFMTYHADISQTLSNAARFLQEADAQAVKLEGGERVAAVVEGIVSCGIPVMGHIGLTPQSVHQLGGFRVQGRSPDAAVQLVRDAEALEKAGAFGIVLECVPAPLAKIITEHLTIPTIGIGAGPHCDGQVQVIHDLLGLIGDFVPRHARQYAKLYETIRGAVGDYMAEVKEGAFPTMKHGFRMDDEVVAEVLERLK